AENDLDERHVPAVSHCRDADDGEGARLRGDDGEADAPPGRVFAAKEVVAGVALVFAEPHAKSDDAAQIAQDDQPIGKVEEPHAEFVEVKGEPLVCCSQIGWAFVAPHLAFGAARRGSISAAICDRGATKPKAKCGATLRAACLFGPGFVVRSLQTAEGSARRSRLV